MVRVLQLLLVILSMSCYAQEIPLEAQTVLVVDADTNEILIDRNGDEARAIASITKLMTAIVTLDANLPLEEEITISQDEVIATKLRGKPTSTSLPVGTKLTRDQLLLLTLMNSHNRAAAALARTYPGGTTAFIRAMNQKAADLGMVNTKYVDPTGLYNENISTAHDLVTLMQHAYTYQLIRVYSTERSFTSRVDKNRSRTFQTTNVFVRQNKWDIVLQKTGYIRDAGRCVVMMAYAGIRRIIIVVLNANTNDIRAADVLTIKHFVETGDIRRMQLERPKSKRKTRGRKQ